MTSRWHSAPRRRIAAALATAASWGVLLAAASSVGAATQIGDPSAPVFNLCGADTLIQSGSPSGQYAVPSAGVLTSWSYTAGPTPPQRKLKVAHPTSGNGFRIVGESEPVMPIANSPNSHPTQISVQAGDLIGFYQSTSGSCGVRGPVSGYSFHYLSGADPLLGSAPVFSGPVSNTQLSIAAVLEPDCDLDGLGDETQDPDISPCTGGSKTNRTLILDADKSKVRKGKKILLSGQLDATGNVAACASSQVVELQRKKPGQTVFTTVEQPQTTASGAFSSKEKIKNTFEFRAQVVETAACGAAISNTEKVKVVKKR
jgi:hypothetical protein